MGVAWVRILPRQGVRGAQSPETIDFFCCFYLLKFLRCDSSNYLNLAK